MVSDMDALVCGHCALAPRPFSCFNDYQMEFESLFWLVFYSENSIIPKGLNLYWMSCYGICSTPTGSYHFLV